jgi:hypothetical protein
LAEVFDVKARARMLERFRADLEAFLEESGMDDMELGRRVFYMGPAQHRICFMEEPPIPARILPESYPLAGLMTYLSGFMARRWKSIETYYLTLCEQTPLKGERK